MIIRSQDKKLLANFEQLSDMYVRNVCEKFFIIADMSGDYTMAELGEYSTEEKAIKVLDMIQNAYVGGSMMIVSGKNGNTYNPLPIVFQMPQDSEVQL